MSPRKSRRIVRLVVAAALGSLALAGSAVAAPVRPPSTDGAFVIGDQSAQLGAHVTFWGAQWWKENDLSGGDAPPSFKGWAHVADMTCVVPWTTRPGNSSEPPAGAGDVIAVLVAGEIAKSGPVISGDAVNVALVAVDPGYGPAPGHAGTGTIVGFSGCGWGDTF